MRYKDELKAKKRKKLLAGAVGFGLLIVAGAIGAVYLLFFARLLDVRNITIESSEELYAGIDSAVTDWLGSGLWGLTKRSNILFWSDDALASRLITQIPELESVAITRDFPHTLVISVKERKPEGVWCLSAQAGLSGQDWCFYFDKNGVAFGESRPSDGFLILNVIDQRSRELNLGDRVAEGVWITNIIKARESLAKNNINVSAFVIPPDSFDEFHAKTAEGWKIRFGNQTDIESQINALAVFLKEKISASQRASLQYVDLRIQDRIYYK